MKKTVIESIREYFNKCPILDEEGLLSVDSLSKEPINYSIDTMPADPIVFQYVDGSSVNQHVFTFNSKEVFGSNTDNLENLGFYERLTEWIKEQNKIGHYPKLEGNRVPVKLEASTGGYLFDAETNTGTYQIQLRLLYLENY